MREEPFYAASNGASKTPTSVLDADFQFSRRCLDGEGAFESGRYQEARSKLCYLASVEYEPAVLYLSELYRKGALGFVKDGAEADRLLSVLVNKNSVQAMCRLAEVYLQGEPDSSTQAKAEHLLKRAFDMGSLVAAVRLAKLAELSGDSDQVDHWVEQALLLVNRVPRRDDESIVKVARLLVSATHLRNPYEGASRRYTRLAYDQIYLDEKQQIRLEKATEILEPLADEEMQYGECNDLFWNYDDTWQSAVGALARIRLFSIGRSFCPEKGKELLDSAASLKDDWALYHKACLLYAGEDAPFNRWSAKVGLERNQREAVCLWHELACSEANLHRLYAISARTFYAIANAKAIGVSRDIDEAIRHFEESAHVGDTLAQFCLAHLSLTDKFVERDHSKSLYWATLSAATGLKQAETLRDQLELELSKNEVRSVQAAARAFFEQQHNKFEWLRTSELLKKIRHAFPIDLSL